MVWLATSPASADDPCAEPSDPAYAEAMMAARDAIVGEDFEATLEHLDWAMARYDFAPLRFSRARALHRLERFNDAEAAYTDFLGAYEGCEDPQGLMQSARDYRSSATSEYARQVADAANRQLEEAQAAALEVEQANAESAVQAPANEAEEPVEPAPVATSNPVPWIIMGGGAALVATGLVYDVANQDLLDDRDAAASAGDQVRFDQLNEDVRSVKVVEGVLFGVGAAAIIGGLVYYLTSLPDAAPAERVSVTFVDQGAVLAFSGIF